MNNLTVGTKITLGIASIVLITVLLGLFVMKQLMIVGEDADNLSTASIPEVRISSEIERILQAAFDRSTTYSLGRNPQSYEEAIVFLDSAKESLSKAKQLGESIQSESISRVVSKIRNQAATYRGLLQDTHTVFAQMRDRRVEMDTSASVFMREMREFLKWKKTELEGLLSEQVHGVAWGPSSCNSLTACACRVTAY